MEVFDLRETLIQDYETYVNSFVTVRDDRILERVDEDLRSGLLWPEPLIQLNPTFEPDAYIDDLVGEGLLDPECSRIFRVKTDRADHGRDPSTPPPSSRRHPGSHARAGSASYPPLEAMPIFPQLRCAARG